MRGIRYVMKTPEKCKCGEEHHKVQYGIGGVYTYCEKCGKTVGFWEDPEWREPKGDES